VNDGELAQAERSALCDLLVEVGPGHPTLCEGWTSADLAAHLVVRERKPLAAAGILGGPLQGHGERVRQKIRDHTPYAQLVERVRSGPPPWLRPVDGAMNLSEFFIHHEDVRRGTGSTEPRSAADVAELEGRLWAMQGRRTKFLTRRLEDVDLTLDDDRGEAKHIGGGSRPVTLRGRPGELVLFLSGRRDAARVELEGEPAAVEELRNGRLGL